MSFSQIWLSLIALVFLIAVSRDYFDLRCLIVLIIHAILNSTWRAFFDIRRKKALSSSMPVKTLNAFITISAMLFPIKIPRFWWSIQEYLRLWRLSETKLWRQLHIVSLINNKKPNFDFSIILLTPIHKFSLYSQTLSFANLVLFFFIESPLPLLIFLLNF